jgi:hypothetical protein
MRRRRRGQAELNAKLAVRQALLLPGEVPHQLAAEAQGLAGRRQAPFHAPRGARQGSVVERRAPTEVGAPRDGWRRGRKRNGSRRRGEHGRIGGGALPTATGNGHGDRDGGGVHGLAAGAGDELTFGVCGPGLRLALAAYLEHPLPGIGRLEGHRECPARLAFEGLTDARRSDTRRSRRLGSVCRSQYRGAAQTMGPRHRLSRPNTFEAMPDAFWMEMSKSLLLRPAASTMRPVLNAPAPWPAKMKGMSRR